MTIFRLTILIFIFSMDDTSMREYSHDKFETEDEDDEDDIFMEADYSIGGTKHCFRVF